MLSFKEVIPMKRMSICLVATLTAFPALPVEAQDRRGGG
jgi:hypothetical protein